MFYKPSNTLCFVSNLIKMFKRRAEEPILIDTYCDAICNTCIIFRTFLYELRKSKWGHSIGPPYTYVLFVGLNLFRGVGNTLIKSQNQP